MPLVKNVEKKIWDVEGFDVCFRNQNGADVKGNKKGIVQYPYTRAARNNTTVNDWKQSRFNNCYCGFEVDVLDGQGIPAKGQTKLGTVRDTYLEDEQEVK